jgi:predicted permease
MRLLDNIIIAFSVVFPLMLMMFVGYELQKFKITDTHSLNVMNKMVFRVFLPLLLFLNIYSLNPEEALNKENAKLIILCSSCIIGSIIISHFLFSLFVKDKKKCSVMIQGIFRSNLILFGIPIAASLYGENRIGIVSLLASFIVPLYNLLAVVVLEYYRGGKVNMKSLLLGIIKNPLIVASLFAFLLLILQIKIPELFLSPLESMSKVATPLAFIVLGGTFRFDQLSGNVKYLSVVTIGKLIVLPGIMITLAIICGFRTEALVALIGVAAAPTAVSSFSMALEMDADGELAGQIVIITSIVCIITIFLWVLALRTLNFI